MFADNPNLPRFEKWKGDIGDSLGLWDFAAREGGSTLALAFASMFWPRFTLVDGCVVVSELHDPAAFARWRAQLGDQRQAIERVVNHIHLWDLFDPESEGVSSAMFESLADVMAGTWTAAFAAEFPERSSETIVTREGEDYGPTLTIFTLPDGSPKQSA